MWGRWGPTYVVGLLSWKLYCRQRRVDALPGKQKLVPCPRLYCSVPPVPQGLQLLERAIAGQYELAALHPPSLEMYVVLAPGRVTNAVKTLLGGLGGEPRAATEAPSPQLGKCSRALELLLKHVRGGGRQRGGRRGRHTRASLCTFFLSWRVHVCKLWTKGPRFNLPSTLAGSRHAGGPAACRKSPVPQRQPRRRPAQGGRHPPGHT